MRRTASFFLFFFLSSFAWAHTTPSFSGKSSQLKEYYLSGTYFKEIEKKLAEAKDYLARQVAYPRSNRLAIVLDIDETVLSNYAELEKLNFTHNSQALTVTQMLAQAEPIQPLLDLYQYAITNNVAIFFVSERPNTPEMMIMTSTNLKKAGFTRWEELILKPIEPASLSIEHFKTTTRRHIAARGFDIIINVGDQAADLQGGFAEVKVKLPNPFYEIA